MTTGAPKRLTRGAIACLLVLLCSFGLCGCDFGDLFKTTKDKQTATTEQVEKATDEKTSEGESTEGEAVDAAGSEAEKDSPSSSGSSSEPESSSPGESTPASEPEPEPEPEPEYATISVHVLVDATNAGRGYFADIDVELPEGATVFDALVATGLSFGGNSEYVRSINGLAEKDVSPSSGWMYSVNGNVPMTPCGGYTLNSGDNVRWYYVTSYSDM